jgi:hypothetical protein
MSDNNKMTTKPNTTVFVTFQDDGFEQTCRFPFNASQG